MRQGLLLMFNEKPKMGFTEYLNSLLLRETGSSEVQYFYYRQASALERAFGFEPYHSVSSFLEEPPLPEGSIRVQDSADYGFLGLILHQRVELFRQLDAEGGICEFPAQGVEERILNEYGRLQDKVKISRETMMGWIDRHLWNRLVGRPWQDFNLKELRERYGYPAESEMDVIADNF